MEGVAIRTTTTVNTTLADTFITGDQPKDIPKWLTNARVLVGVV